MQDPGFGVSRDLIQHVHLLSTYRYPMLPQLHHEKVAQLLLAAPKIARDQAPFYWTYLDRPATGTILLTWQPQSILGTDFSSDGFIWAPGETAYQMDVNVEGGVYTLEMYQAKVGYAPGEPYAIHSRKRYRLLPPKFPSPNGQTPDPSLWIVHYSDATQQDRVPSNVIPVDVRTNTIMSTRQYLQSQGQIVQKEFMLHDRASWPQIQFPRGGAQRGPQIYGGNQPPVRVPQTMAYPPQHAAPGPPPSKRARTQNNASQSTAAVTTALDVADDDEDTSRGDIFDVLTPREISTERYMLNHRWMEEILSSPYSIHQIIPPDLGLGLKGELADLTEGIFDAPFVIEPTKRLAKYNYVGQLDGDKADEFRKRAAERIAQTNVEIEKMKAKHTKRLAKFKKGSIVTTAEKELRTAVNEPADVGPEYWRLEGKIDEEDGDDGKAITRVPSKVDDILAQVVESLGKHTEAVQEFRRIQDGGFEEPPAVQSPPAQQPSRNGSHQSGRSGHLVGDADVEMGESSAAGLLDQFNPGPSSTSTPGSNAILNMLGRVGTPGSVSVQSPQPAPATSTPQPSVQQPTTIEPDVSMSNSGPPVSAVAPAEGTGTGDWVVVPPGGVSPAPSATASAQNQQTTSAAASAAPTPQPVPPTTTSNETPNETTTSTDAIPGFEVDSNDFGDLGDLDTAGDALAGYGGEEIGGDLGDLGVDMDMGMDDSAFGEAFHGVETRGADGETGDGDGI